MLQFIISGKLFEDKNVELNDDQEKNVLICGWL